MASSDEQFDATTFEETERKKPKKLFVMNKQASQHMNDSYWTHVVNHAVHANYKLKMPLSSRFFLQRLCENPTHFYKNGTDDVKSFSSSLTQI